MVVQNTSTILLLVLLSQKLTDLNNFVDVVWWQMECYKLVLSVTAE